jgi:hypothetical protein
MADIRVFPEQETRVESGPIRFGDDWPGYFIRGDHTFALLLAIRDVLQNNDASGRRILRSFARAFGECNLNRELDERIQKEFGE